MPSPFPGMNPFLEDPAFWQDFHETFILCWRRVLRAALPEGYEARIGEKIYLIEPPGDVRLVERDLALTHSEASVGVARLGANPLVVPEPVTLPLVILEEPREAYVQIIRRSDRALVAVLELLSPYNKREPGRGDYLGKRNALLKQDVHLVELDLLLEGRRLPLRGALPDGDYFAFVSRSNRRPNCEVYHWGLRDALPAIPIPLRAPDSDVVIDLGAAFLATFEEGFYDASPEFGRQLPVPLSKADAEWVAERMRASGR